MTAKNKEVNEIGVAYEKLAAATKEYRNAQVAYQKALERLQNAENAHTDARVAFTQQTLIIKGATSVKPIEA